MQADEKCIASIGAMQGVLPSYTPLGMASLLPHKAIEYSSSYDVLVDGKVCSSTEQREAILKEYKINSKCVQFDGVKTMKQADLRSIFTGQDVVYIYHNQIDARGDKAASENEVFTACEEAIEEIYTLIKKIASQAKLYIQTGKVKDVSKQIHANPKVEVCALKNGEWLRVAGELVEDDRREARQSMLDAYPSLQNMYSADDGNTEVFYFKNATATFSSFTNEPEVVKF